MLARWRRTLVGLYTLIVRHPHRGRRLCQVPAGIGGPVGDGVGARPPRTGRIPVIKVATDVDVDAAGHRAVLVTLTSASAPRPTRPLRLNGVRATWRGASLLWVPDARFVDSCIGSLSQTRYSRPLRSNHSSKCSLLSERLHLVYRKTLEKDTGWLALWYPMLAWCELAVNRGKESCKQGGSKEDDPRLW